MIERHAPGFVLNYSRRNCCCSRCGASLSRASPKYLGCLMKHLRSVASGAQTLTSALVGSRLTFSSTGASFFIPASSHHSLSSTLCPSLSLLSFFRPISNSLFDGDLFFSSCPPCFFSTKKNWRETRSPVFQNLQDRCAQRVSYGSKKLVVLKLELF